MKDNAILAAFAARERRHCARMAYVSLVGALAGVVGLNAALGEYPIVAVVSVLTAAFNVMMLFCWVRLAHYWNDCIARLEQE